MTFVNSDPEQSPAEYEEAIADLFKKLYPASQVERAYTLITADQRRIIFDVVVIHNAPGGGTLYTVVECKRWNSSVEVGRVDEFVGKLHNIGFVHAMIVAKSGFQSGAIDVARRSGIILYTFDIGDTDLVLAESISESYDSTARTGPIGYFISPFKPGQAMAIETEKDLSDAISLTAYTKY